MFSQQALSTHNQLLYVTQRALFSQSAMQKMDCVIYSLQYILSLARFVRYFVPPLLTNDDDGDGEDVEDDDGI